jgi:tetratricopeptide (TPR) repeat protein
MSTSFSSEGFDLDALKATGTSDDEVVYEIGGGATTVPSTATTTTTEPDEDIDPAEAFKQQGNEQFKQGNYLEAYDVYTEAIRACPGTLTADEILQQRDAFLEAEREKSFSRQRLEEETRRTTKEEKKETDKKPQPIPQFELPAQPNGEQLAVYYCNRAATLIHMDRHDDAVKDCDVAILLNPKYLKGYVRRSSAYEKLDNTDDALRDAKSALQLEPSNAVLRNTVARLQKIEDERLEKLKAETLDKLKDLGNSLLGNFGLSLDNFQAVQDPNTGSYSISFNQNK